MSNPDVFSYGWVGLGAQILSPNFFGTRFVKKNRRLGWEVNFKAAVMQVEKALINERLHVSKVSWNLLIPTIYNFSVIYSWNLLFS